jgi:hypothetical protein
MRLSEPLTTDAVNAWQRSMGGVQAQFQTLDFLGRPKWTSVELTALSKAQDKRPLVTWQQSNGDDLKTNFFFVHQELLGQSSGLDASTTTKFLRLLDRSSSKV